MPAAAAPRRTPATGGNSGSATASGETGVAMGRFPMTVTRLLLGRGGGRFGGIGGADLRPVEVEPLDRRRGARLRHDFLHALLDHLLAQLVVRLREIRRLGAAPLHYQDDVPAELAVHRLR